MKEMLPELGYWIGICALLLFARHRFNKTWGNTELSWNPTAEEALEAAQYAAYCNRRGESHLRVVSGGLHGKSDPEAIRSDRFGFYSPVKTTNPAA